MTRVLVIYSGTKEHDLFTLLNKNCDYDLQNVLSASDIVNKASRLYARYIEVYTLGWDTVVDVSYARYEIETANSRRSSRATI